MKQYTSEQTPEDRTAISEKTLLGTPPALPFFASFGSRDYHYRQQEYAAVCKRNNPLARLAAWKGEQCSAVIVLATKDKPVQNLDAVVTTFSGAQESLPSGIVRVHALKEVQAFIGKGKGYDDPAKKEWIPDVVFGALPIDVPAQQVQVLWLQIAVPRNIEAGQYRATVTLSCEGVREKAVLGLALEVLDLELPQRADFAGSHFGLELWQYPYSVARYYGIAQDELFGQRHCEILKKHLKPYRDAGGDSISVSIVEDPWIENIPNAKTAQTYDAYPSMVKWTKKADGNLTFDYTHFDAYVSLCMEMGIDQQIKSFSMVPWRNRLQYWDEKKAKMIAITPKPGSRKWEKLWDKFLSSYITHLETMGWFDITYIAMDERPFSTMQAVVQMVNSHANSKGESLKISGAMNYKSTKPEMQRIFDQVHDVSVNLGHIEMDGTAMRDFAQRRREQGLRTTVYTCVGDYPSSFTRSDPAETVWSIWYAFSQGADGFLRWAYDAWNGNPLQDVSYRLFESGDIFYIYPGDVRSDVPEPRYSPRFYRLQEGMQDIAKARFLMGCDEGVAERVLALAESLGRVRGKANAYGAMEAGSNENRKFIMAEVHRMQDGLLKIARDYLQEGGAFADFQLDTLQKFLGLAQKKDRSKAGWIAGIGAAAVLLGGTALHRWIRRRKKAKKHQPLRYRLRVEKR